MKNFFTVFVLTLFFSFSTKAQKGSTLLSLGADLAIPTSDFGDLFNVGPGVRAKMLFGVTPAGYITATTGINSFSAKSEFLDQGESITFRVIPILAGYHHNFNGFYIEPQIGFGVYSATAKANGQSESSSTNAFTWSAGFGYLKNNVEVGLRYQGAEKDGESFSLFGVNVSYVFNLGKSKR
ncbi:MAG: outer membrane beta-barrel protein [Bacteroidota bacterium]